MGSLHNAYPGAACVDTSEIYYVADRSARGAFFEPGSWTDFSGEWLHNTRVKPDLVAPGVQVQGAVPFDPGPSPSNPPGPYDCPIAGCEDYIPSGPNPPTLESFTIGGGTSYAAPAVSGAAALFTDWMGGLHPGVTASPSLVKAALIATADELIDYDNGGQCWLNDCRPSYRGGWGRLNIGRLTDPDVNHLFINEDQPLMQDGSVIVENLRVHNPAKDVLIVLVWSDQASEPLATEALVNDLDLAVYSDLGSAIIPDPIDYLGNNFNENIQSIDDGYSYAFTPYMFAYAARPDHTNNVEAVFIPASAYDAIRRFDIEVVGYSVNDPNGQDFSVFAYNLEPAP